MSEEIVHLLLSRKAITIYGIVIIGILIFLFLQRLKKSKQFKERRRISNIRSQNARLETLLKNPDIKLENTTPPNPFEIQYKHNGKHRISRFQIGIEVRTDVRVQKYLFDLDKEVTIGNDLQNTLPVREKGISPKCCSIFLKGKSVYLQALGGRDPVFLQRGRNRKRMQNQLVKLRNKDRLLLGNTALIISIYKN